MKTGTVSIEDQEETLHYMFNRISEEIVRTEQELVNLRERHASINCKIKLLEYIKEQNGRTN